MSEMKPFPAPKKPFWKRPEGVTGTIFLIAILAALGYGLYLALPFLITIVQNALYLTILLLVLGAIIYMIADPRMRNLVAYSYRSLMRKITGFFVTIDPIGILKNYIDDLRKNLHQMSKQIGNLRGQMRKIKTVMEENEKEIENNLILAKKAREQENSKQMALSTRKASRLKESNEKYAKLLTKMELLYKVLTKMYQNSEILLEDTQDQVNLKEQERKAIRTSHGAMKSAMNVISGNSDRRIMFDQALEAIADDVASKVGEMERFMELSANFMDTVDLQNGVFEEKGLAMLEQWEKESSLMLDEGISDEATFDLDSPRAEPLKKSGEDSSKYDRLFE